MNTDEHYEDRAVRLASELRRMGERANTARGASWEHGAFCATHLCDSADMIMELLAKYNHAEAERIRFLLKEPLYNLKIHRLEEQINSAAKESP